MVADEVRNLATKSQEASSQTTILIENSARAVAQGVVLVNTFRLRSHANVEV